MILRRGGISALIPGPHPIASAAAALTILLLAGCADKPPIISADTSCERFRHISFSDAQIAAVGANWDLWESAANQIVEHNVEYDKHCLPGPPAP